MRGQHGSERSPLPRVVYWNTLPAPYIVERFNAVARRCDLDFEAWFNSREQADRSWEIDESKWEFPYRYVPSATLRGHTYRLPANPLKGRRPDIIVSPYAGYEYLLGWLLSRSLSIRSAFVVVSTSDSWVERKAWKEELKSRLFPRADGFLVPGEDAGRFVRGYGGAPDRILELPNVVNIEHFAGARRSALPESESLRDRLQLKGSVFVCVGRLWRGKGLDTLVDAFKLAQSRCAGDISLLLVGDGEEEVELRERCRTEGIRNVVFAGFQQKQNLPSYLAASDVFVFPTLGDPYGQVVDEAMACSLPVIATSAAGEIRQRVQEGRNGFVVPPGDSESLARRMHELAGSRETRARMAVESAAIIAPRTVSSWADRFEVAMRRILELPRSRVVVRSTGG